METKADKFLSNGEWSEDAYQKHVAERMKHRWEKENAPWRIAMREWLKKGGYFQSFAPGLAKKMCMLDCFCTGDVYRRKHGHAPCAVCPYGYVNYELFRELSEVFKELWTDECCQQRGDNE